MRPHPWTLLVLFAAIAGFSFAAVSTYDFVLHLDRDVHGLHCSFIPGMSSGAANTESGCAVTLMSPYSSVLRSTIWGGIPISLAAMGVFGFLVFWCLFLILTNRENHLRPAGFLFAATLVPALTSAVMAYLSLTTLNAVCKVCVGIYVSSGVALLSALFLFLRATPEADLELLRPRPAPREGTYDDYGSPHAAQVNRRLPGFPRSIGWGALIGAFFLGVLFVALPVSAYALGAPDFSKYIGRCGTLDDPPGATPEGVYLPLGPRATGVPMLEILDPLCPSCRGFERRLSGLKESAKLTRRAVLFPLDSECNWMVDKAIHPGACAISEAMLCSADRASEVLEWAFTEQERIVEAARADKGAARRMVTQRFPELSECVGSPAARARLNLSLRWAVSHSLPVLTPQIYVGSTRVCPADTDLGMDFVVTKLIERTPASPPPPPYPAIEAGKHGAPMRAPAPAGGTAPRRPPTAPSSTAGPARAPGAAPASPQQPGAPAPAGTTAAEPVAKPAAKPAAEAPAARTEAPPAAHAPSNDTAAPKEKP